MSNPERCHFKLADAKSSIYGKLSTNWPVVDLEFCKLRKI